MVAERAGRPRRPRCVTAERAEFLDMRGNSIIIGLKLAAARLSGKPPDLPESRKVGMH